jgi:hypothetical protein
LKCRTSERLIFIGNDILVSKESRWKTVEWKSRRIQEKCILALRRESFSFNKVDFHKQKGYNI